jgi:hypothetical protein
MELNSSAIESFKGYIVESMNVDVYYQLKDWINQGLDEDQDFNKAMDFFVDNLHGSLQWID